MGMDSDLKSCHHFHLYNNRPNASPGSSEIAAIDLVNNPSDIIYNKDMNHNINDHDNNGYDISNNIEDHILENPEDSDNLGAV